MLTLKIKFKTISGLSIFKTRSSQFGIDAFIKK